MKRVLTAVALVPFVVAVVFWGNFWVFVAVVWLVASLCYREYSAIAADYGFGAPGVIGYAAGGVLLLWEGDAWWLLVVVAIVGLTAGLRDAELGKALPRAALLVMGVVYIYGCWKCALPIRERSAHWLMYGLLVNWVGDIGAYYVGRNFGRHKMAPRVSPKKSWEGAAASVVTSIVVAGGYLVRTVPGVSIAVVVLLTMAANAAGQVGDLAESAIKRGAGVKDSGGILPGHGGFFDRVDSTLFSLPVIYAYLKFIG